ncbi:hypothetical protein B9J93_21205 [Vibrio sp. V17_P4S1T151]|uniref:hypothetical protein n=1 Tax=unclassified Vibrio TaxID=2614977 RepID=UPI000B8E538F|nr:MULTISPECIES: hypothetical protein [unclassified Vibrio]OXX40855.1 hypothetical protein B9J93_21205 [Vibrio sp. V17_P4S1T151]OXX64559.1 hypothetical protein B9J89_01310 [Vibrio sp. V15_P4S5T153]
MIKVITPSTDPTVRTGIKINITDKKINDSVEGISMFRDLPCGNLQKIAESLIRIHQYATVQMVVETKNDELIELLSTEATKQGIEENIFL